MSLIGLFAILCIILLFSAYLFLLFKSFIKKSFLTFFVVGISPYIAYKVFQYCWYVSAVPSEIGITWSITIGDEFYGREGCGVAVFKLSRETIEAIKARGLRYFDSATQGRGHTNDYYYRYETWKETPVPSDWTSNGTWIMCSVISNDLIHKITEAAKRKGSYYTTKSEGELIVFPALGFVVFSYYG